MTLPESTVYLRASWATMLTRPSNREAIAEPRSLRKRDSHTRQYCSPHSPRLPHGAWKEPEVQHLCFFYARQPGSTYGALESEVLFLNRLYEKGYEAHKNVFCSCFFLAVEESFM